MAGERWSRRPSRGQRRLERGRKASLRSWRWRHGTQRRYTRAGGIGPRYEALCLAQIVWVHDASSSLILQLFVSRMPLGLGNLSIYFDIGKLFVQIRHVLARCDIRVIFHAQFRQAPGRLRYRHRGQWLRAHNRRMPWSESALIRFLRTGILSLSDSRQ